MANVLLINLESMKKKFMQICGVFPKTKVIVNLEYIFKSITYNNFNELSYVNHENTNDNKTKRRGRLLTKNLIFFIHSIFQHSFVRCEKSNDIRTICASVNIYI